VNERTETTQEIVHFAAKAAATAYHDVIDSGATHAAADAAARVAFKCCMPTLESRSSVQAFIATVVRGMELHLITTRESQQYIKAARLWISAETGKVAA
jgi:hypothetical protein